MFVLHFRHAAPFRKQGDSKASVVEIEDKFQPFCPPPPAVKITEQMGEMFVCPLATRTLDRTSDTLLAEICSTNSRDW